MLRRVHVRLEVADHAEHALRMHLQAGFFEYFAHHRGFHGFHPVHLAAGQPPMALLGRPPAQHQQQAAVGPLEEGATANARAQLGRHRHQQLSQALAHQCPRCGGCGECWPACSIAARLALRSATQEAPAAARRDGRHAPYRIMPALVRDDTALAPHWRGWPPYAPCWRAAVGEVHVASSRHRRPRQGGAPAHAAIGAGRASGHCIVP
ncbi:hypothetical protein XFF6990_90181 [Xanthomonas citri pv. fuscans]|nr:hypothetical protein XFF6990_90181 [Xanthomonas citri pv. fuscans]